MIQLGCKKAGDLARFIPQLAHSLLDGLFGLILNLSLRFLLVPFRGFEELLDHLVFQVADSSFQLLQAPVRDGL